MASAGDYEVRFEPCPKRVRVEFNSERIADSSRAIVVHETRARPVHYFPPSDVRMDLLERTALATHCPFKGNASHWTLRVGERVAENAAWAYEDPYAEAEPIRGYVAFYRHRVDALREGDDGAATAPAEAARARTTALVDWVIGEAWKAASPDELMGGFCRFLHGSGYPIARSTVIIPTLHPQIFATVLVWRHDVAGVRTVHEPHDILLTPRFADSPFAPIIRGAGGVRRRLEDPEAALDFPVVRDLHAEGATDYVAMPFRFSNGQINVISMTSFTAGGFSTAHLGTLYEAMPMLGCLFEVHAQRRVATGLLETYLGRHTGKRVLDGQIKLGDGERIHAVIWFCDLRDSTRLCAAMEPAQYLVQLNRYFAAMAGAVIDNGGEILSYIGDAVLAIFPIAASGHPAGTNPRGGEACAQAIRAAKEAAARIARANGERPELPALRYGIGLHVGDVTYGNIGVPTRLQFTVIGSAANEASRIEGMTKELGEAVLVSAPFAALHPQGLLAKGAHELKGVAGRHELYALA